MHDIILIIIMALVTAATRFLPFLIFGEKKETPELITYLGKVLPFAIMGMLVVYCMKDVAFLEVPFGAPEILGCVIVAVLHLWKRNSLLSLGVGSVAYMLMVQLIF